MVRMSTTSWLSTQGRLKWRPEGAKAGAKQREIDPYFLLPKMCDDFFCVCVKRKDLPGPLDPPSKRRPKRNMTALSYSCTTCKRISIQKGWEKVSSFVSVYLETHAERKWQSDDNNDPGEGCKKPPAYPDAYVPFVGCKRKQRYVKLFHSIIF